MHVVHSTQSLSYRLTFGHEPLNRLGSEIFSCRQTYADRHTDTSHDNKGRLKLAVLEPMKTVKVFESHFIL